MDIKVMQTNACAAAAFLKILANDWRLMILCELLKGERSVGELEEIVSLRRRPQITESIFDCPSGWDSIVAGKHISYRRD